MAIDKVTLNDCSVFLDFSRKFFLFHKHFTFLFYNNYNK